MICKIILVNCIENIWQPFSCVSLVLYCPSQFSSSRSSPKKQFQCFAKNKPNLNKVWTVLLSVESFLKGPIKRQPPSWLSNLSWGKVRNKFIVEFLTSNKLTFFLSVSFNCPFCLFLLTVFSVVTVITVHTVLTVLFVFFCPLSVCLTRLSYFLSFCLSFRLVLLEAVGDISRLSKVTLSLSLSSREKRGWKGCEGRRKKGCQ